MKLLILTQAVDSTDTTLGFFVRWISSLAVRFEKVTVICLREGVHTLPANVTVYCLRGPSYIGKLHIAGKFLHLIWMLRREYDSAFVHMNQEYVLLGGLFWRLLHKKIFLWRNHRVGDWKTALAVTFSQKVFYTSRDSFTAHFANAVEMPAGIDVELFEKNEGEERKKNSLLMFGRVAPVKHIEMAIEAMAALKERGVEATLSVVGDALSKDQGYLQSLKDRAEALGVDNQVYFQKGVPFAQAPALYHAYEIFLNFTPSGSFDKTVFEALAAGCKVLVTNDSMKGILPDGSWTDANREHVADKIQRLLSLDVAAEHTYKEDAVRILTSQSLDALVGKLVQLMI